MATSLKDYSGGVLDGMLGFLWRQWSALGVAGYGGQSHRHFVDPEAALMLLCACGRYDARLFDEALDWLVKYERFVNVQRLRTIVGQEPCTGTAVLAGVARFLAKRTKQRRWDSLCPAKESTAEPIPLFLGRDGRPLPVLTEPDPDFLHAGLLRGPALLRGHSGFRTVGKGAALTRLRALLGVNARCEILLFLMTHPFGYPRRIAAEGHYAQKTIHDALDDMALSGFIRAIKGKRERLCRLETREFVKTLLDKGAAPEWVNWPRVLGALDQAWTALDALARDESDPLLERSQAQAVADALTLRLHGAATLPELPAPKNDELAAALLPFQQTLKLLEG
jgi:hypothetical protein